MADPFTSLLSDILSNEIKERPLSSYFDHFNLFAESVFDAFPFEIWRRGLPITRRSGSARRHVGRKMRVPGRESHAWNQKNIYLG
jgi:hypothetical protein